MSIFDTLCRNVLASLVLCLVIGLTGCHSSLPHSPGVTLGSRVFRLNLGTEPPSLDPMEISDLVAMTVETNLMRGLTQYDDQHGIAPALASHWTMSSDGRRYVFYLRPNLRWSDGKPLTAHDFVYGWHRLLNPKNGAVYAYLLFCIDNAQAYYDGKIKDPNAIGVRALNDSTLEVRLKHPLAYFLQLTAFAPFLPQRQDVIERYGNQWTEAGHFPSSGPFILSEWEHENAIVLKPNPNYWAGAPKLDAVQMLMVPEANTSTIMYDNNELDFIETTSSLPRKEVRRLLTHPELHQTSLHAILYTGVNTQKPPLNNVLVRRALSMAVDRSYFPKLFQSGEQPIASWITPGLVGYDPKAGLPFDVKQAQALLAKAGYPNGKGLPPIDFFFNNSTPENRQIGEILQYQWKKHLGVKVNLVSTEWKVFLKQLQQDPPHLYLLQWYVDYPDSDSFMSMNTKASGNNHTRWSDKNYDTWVAEAALEQNPAMRAKLYAKAQLRLLNEGAAIIPLYVIPKTYLVKPWVKGFTLDELNVVRLENVTITSH